MDEQYRDIWGDELAGKRSSGNRVAHLCLFPHIVIALGTHPFRRSRLLAGVVLLSTAPFVRLPAQQLPVEDGVRIREFYRLASEIQDQIWPTWSQVRAPLLLVTPETEFLTQHARPPADFKKVGDDWYARPRQFPADFQATFPAFGPPSVIVIGEAKHTASKTSTPWLITLMHEHFHQLQTAQPAYFGAVQALGLSHGDNTGMWMLTYPFPYQDPAVGRAFSGLRDLLLRAVTERDTAKFASLADRYRKERKTFFARLSPEDHKYFSFQLWQEGIARYTEIRAAEAAAHYQPTPEYAALSDYEPFASYARRVRTETLRELERTDLARAKRTAVYPFGAVEGLLLDRLNPTWRDRYFDSLLSTDAFFEP